MGFLRRLFSSSGSKKPWFKCFVRGENFPGDVISESELFGFYTTRFVQAKDPQEAEAIALKRLKENPMLQKPPECKPNGVARVYFEEIEQVAAELVPEGDPGIVWFKMEDDQEPG